MGKKIINPRSLKYSPREVKNFRELVDYTAKTFPDHVAYKYKKDATAKEPEYIEKTFSQFQSDIKFLGTELLDLGLEGKKIAVIGSNCYEWCTTYLAATTSNIVIVPLDKSLPENEISSLIARSGVDIAIFEQKFEKIFIKLKKDTDINLKYLVCMDTPANTEEVIPFQTLLEKGKALVEAGDTRYDNIKIDEDKMSVLLFTSGTTNAPKGVMLSQKNICSNLEYISCWVKLYPTDTLLSFLPIHHTFECTITFLYGLYSGCTVAFCDGLKYIAKNLKEYEVSVLIAVPLVLETMYKKIQKGIEEKGKTKLVNTMSKVSNTLLNCKVDVRKVLFKSILDQMGGHLRVVLYGAAPMDKQTILGFNSLGINLVQGYGLTETSPVISAETDDYKKAGSIGFPLFNLEVKIENPDKDGIGEITAKGPSIMLGYYENEEATAKVLKDGWFSTGDYGYIDEDGFLFITGRKSDVIVLKNGKNVYPQEIEFLINKISYVDESLVYARENSNTDTVLCAKIVYNEDLIKEYLGEKSEEEYKAAIWEKMKEMNKTLPDFKHIKEIMITKEPLEKTTTQKVQRFKELKKIGE